MSKVPVLSSYDDSMSDEVFEDADLTTARTTYHNGKSKAAASSLGVAKARAEAAAADLRTPSPTGYPGYKPPKEALQMYAFENEYFQVDRDGTDAVRKNHAKAEAAETKETDDDCNAGDGWQSYQIEDTFDESIIHKVSDFLCENHERRRGMMQIFIAKRLFVRSFIDHFAGRLGSGKDVVFSAVQHWRV